MKSSALLRGVTACVLPSLIGIAVTVRDVSAADNPLEWNAAWTRYQTVLVQETAGYNREHEPVEAEIRYFQTMAERDTTGVGEAVKRTLRVVHRAENRWEEIPCQVYDVRSYHWNNRAEKPEIMVRARVVFMASCPFNMTEVYYILYGNPAAPEPRYKSDLMVSGGGVGYTISNSHFTIGTNPQSGQINKIDLAFAGKPSFSFVHGDMHWNPDFMYVPENFPTTWFTWFYSHNFENPPYEVESGPLFFSVRRSQLVPGQDIAWMEVYYRFYEGLPYFIMESKIVVTKSCHTLAIRNDELAFGSADFTHAGWRNYTDDMLPGHIGEVGAVDIYSPARSGNHILGSALPPNIPWISMCHVDKGYATGSIRLDWENINVITGNPSTIYNSHTVLSEHNNGLYWFRSLVYSQRDDYGDLGWNADDWRAACIDIPDGDSYYEKNAYVFYEWTEDSKFKPIDDLWFRLRSPLTVTVKQ